MSESHVFSTGILRVGPPGATPLDATNIIGVIQDATLETSYTRKDLFDAAINTVFAVDTADHEGKFVLKVTTDDINRKLLAYTTGATHTTGTGPASDIYTVGGKSVPQFCRCEYDGVDTNGKNIHIVIPKAKPNGETVSFKLSDFASLPIDFNGYADQSNNNLVATITIDQ